MPLNEIQFATLQAAIDRIIPPDAFPGGWDAGVGAYILHQLEGDLHDLLPTYSASLDALDAEAAARFQTGFAALSSDRQDDLLRRVEAGDVIADWTVAPPTFFALLVNHAAEGFYSDPGNGGNRNGVSWEMIGFDISRR